MGFGIREWVILLVVIAASLAAIEVGFRLGLRGRGRGDDTARSHFSALQGALLGLLALLLGFTFAMAVARFEDRRMLVMEEANAIGTSYLRSKVLPPGQQQEIQGLLRGYLASRLAYFRAGHDPARIEVALASSSRLQQRIWAVAMAAAKEDQTSVPRALLLESLNEMIDLDEERQVALTNKVPQTVIYLLLCVSVGSLAFTGYGHGLSGQRRHVSTAVFALLILLVILVILDLDQSRRGLIRVSQDSLLRVKAMLEQGTP